LRINQLINHMISIEKFYAIEKAMPRAQFKAILAGDEGEIMLLESTKEWNQYGAVKPRHNGYVIFENSRIVSIATGFREKSANDKTGSMVQVWILVKSHGPIQANKLGLDRQNCGGCSLAGAFNRITGEREGRVCYVNLGQAPEGIYNAWRRGAYPAMDSVEIFRGKSVRLGAYGDPAFLPFPLIKSICDVAKNWTGYTHQWRTPVFSAYKAYLMASADNEAQAHQAHRAGWRTFRLVGTIAERLATEVLCDNERSGAQCVDCGKCNGNGSDALSIVIPAHGTGKANFQ
jgi:hypothetical protein